MPACPVAVPLGVAPSGARAAGGRQRELQFLEEQEEQVALAREAAEKRLRRESNSRAR